MVIQDKELLFSDEQDLSGIDNTSVGSTHEYDLAPMGSAIAATAENLDLFEIGTGERLYLYFRVTTAFTTGTTVQIRLISDGESGQGDTGETTLADSGAIPLADVDAIGDEVWVPIQPGVRSYQYIRVLYTGVGVFGAGAGTCALVKDFSGLKAYGSALSV